MNDENMGDDGAPAVLSGEAQAIEDAGRLASTGQPKIAGHRELGTQEIALMQRIKAMGVELEELCELVADFLYAEQEAGGITVRRETKRGADELSLTSGGLRWLEFGTVELQRGLMFLTRAVARRTSF